MGVLGRPEVWYNVRMEKIARLMLPLLAAAAVALHVEAQAPRDFTSRVTWESLRRFAHTNADTVKKPVRGIIVFHHGLGCVDFKPDLKDWEEDYARHGLVALHPHASPWGWMNGVSVKLADALVDCVIKQLKLPADIPVCSAGGSMGGQGALVYARYSKHHVVSVVADCPVCDLAFHETERPDLPRTFAAALATSRTMMRPFARIRPWRSPLPCPTSTISSSIPPPTAR